MRNALAKTLYELAQQDERIVVLVADISPAGAMEEFRRDFPTRFINVGVAEQSMIGLAAGLAQRGMRPVCYTIATFALFRPYEFIRCDLAYQKLPVTVVGMGAGLSYSTLGGTHQAMEDVAVALACPGLIVLAPSDPEETSDCIRWCLTRESGGPVYMRIGKAGESPVGGLEPWRFGKIRQVRTPDKSAEHLEKMQRTIDNGYMALINREGRELSQRVRTTERSVNALESGYCFAVAFFEAEDSPEPFLTRAVEAFGTEDWGVPLLSNQIAAVPDPLKKSRSPDLVLSYGPIATEALKVARRLGADMFTVPTLSPLDRLELSRLIRQYTRVIVVEEASGAPLSAIVHSPPCYGVGVVTFALPRDFVHMHGTREELLDHVGLTANRILAALG